MNEFTKVFGEDAAKKLIEGFNIEACYEDSDIIGALFYVKHENEILASHQSNLKEFLSEEHSNYQNLINGINSDIQMLKTDYHTKNVSKPLTKIIIQLGTQIYDTAATKEKMNRFEKDFWFVRLRSLLQNDQSKTRKQFIKLAVYWYILIEIEGHTETEVIEKLSKDKGKMKGIADKWDVDNLTGFVERLHYIASTKQIEHFIKIVKTSNASKSVQNEIIEQLLRSDILEVW
ncbi:hypothetical protein [Staphylococcus simulans]|uniref:hypothetical protein n=1 Tax=Staphylococcus simulans TaxID=1286 RepID=UPI000D1F63DB|nr:hypothetical protein [Staphylococcus simulans]PTJ36442.1 hypothetical protein BU024_10285 [Staphylococcus simulans]